MDELEGNTNPQDLNHRPQDLTYGQIFKMWLSKLACHHTWEVHSKTKVYSDVKSSLPTGIIDTVVCTKCGKFKKISY